MIIMLDNFEAIVALLDFTLSSRRKRHIVGGLLLSVSFMFGGLALTAMTLRYEEEEEEKEEPVCVEQPSHWHSSEEWPQV